MRSREGRFRGKDIKRSIRLDNPTRLIIHISEILRFLLLLAWPLQLLWVPPLGVDVQVHQLLGSPHSMKELPRPVETKDETFMLKIGQEKIRLGVDLEQEGGFCFR
jgi:hypothetical protein